MTYAVIDGVYNNISISCISLLNNQIILLVFNVFIRKKNKKKVMVIKESQLREMIKKSIVEHLEEGRFTDFLEKVKKFGRSGAETFFNNTTDDSREWEGEPIDSLHIGPRRGNKVINKIDKALEDFGEPNNGN